MQGMSPSLSNEHILELLSFIIQNNPKRGRSSPAMLPWDMAVVDTWILLFWPQGCFDFILMNINMETSLVIFFFEKALLIQGKLHLANLIP